MTQALSPVPQWTDNRLITPVEGTGYIDMMEGWMREREAAIARGDITSPATPGPGTGAEMEPRSTGSEPTGRFTRGRRSPVVAAAAEPRSP